MSAQQYALGALVIIGCGAMAALVWFVWFPADLRRVLSAKPEVWPRMNEGGGWEHRDGRITRDHEGLDLIRRTR
jgi:hypothetical protein